MYNVHRSAGYPVSLRGAFGNNLLFLMQKSGSSNSHIVRPRPGATRDHTSGISQTKGKPFQLLTHTLANTPHREHYTHVRYILYIGQVLFTFMVKFLTTFLVSYHLERKYLPTHTKSGNGILKVGNLCFDIQLVVQSVCKDRCTSLQSLVQIKTK